MISLKLLFTCPVTGDDISAYVYEPSERRIGSTVTLTCERCGAVHSWPAEEGRVGIEAETTDDEGD
jgi:hypothetical protein